MEEILIQKTCIYKSKIDTSIIDEVTPGLSDARLYNEQTWRCNSNTTLSRYGNILYERKDLQKIKTALVQQVEMFFLQNTLNDKPFMITESWVNVMGPNGYQEFHNHEGIFGSGVLYLSSNNSDIEFCVFPQGYRKSVSPKKGDVIIFDAKTYHRVLHSDKERMSLAFNFRI